MSTTSNPDDPRLGRGCQNCGADISHRRADALRCEACRRKARAASKRAARAAGVRPRCTIPDCVKELDRNGMCQMHNWRLVNHGSAEYTRPVRLCTYPGCTSKHKGHGFCQPHLIRWRNGLTMDIVPRQPRNGRYAMVTRRGHPLAGKTGRVFVHRMVLYDSSGGGRMPCFWCARPLGWGVEKFAPGAIVVDHLDHDRSNNSPTNLVPSCNGCNAGRIRGHAAVRVPQYELAA